MVLALVAGGYWVTIAWWYSLLGHRSHTHFAFEKLPGHSGSPILRGTLLLFLALVVIYVVGYRLLATRRPGSHVARLAAVALVVGPAAANVLSYPVGALDAFNYMIELKLAFHYGENPYLVTFAGFRDDPFALPAFLVDVPLFYGPAWLLASGVPAAVVGFGDFVRLLLALKVFNLLLLGLTALAIFRYQGENRRGWLAAYAFLANPLVLFEGVGNAHNDVMMTLFLVAALLALKLEGGRWSAGPLLTLSALVKFFTAALAPLLVIAALRRRWAARRLLLTALLSVGVAAGAVAPFWAGGEMVDGLRRGVAESQKMKHVSILSLAQQYAEQRWPATAPPTAAPPRPGLFAWIDECRQQRQDAGEPVPSLLALRQQCLPQALVAAPQAAPDGPPDVRRWCAALFVALAVLVAVAVGRGWSLERGSVVTLMLFALLLTNLYPWYLIPIFATLALRPDRLGLAYLFAATALGLAYYPAYVFAHFDSGWPKFQVHLFLALFLTLPMVVFLAAEAGHAGVRFVAARRGGAGRGAAA